MLRIREATADDAEMLADLVTQLGYPSQPEDITRRLRALPPERNCVLVAVVDGTVVRWVHVSTYCMLQIDQAAQLNGLVVGRRQRGQGTGRALMEAAEAWAKERDCTMMYVRSNAQRHDAHAFYRHRGYQQAKISLTFWKALRKEP